MSDQVLILAYLRPARCVAVQAALRSLNACGWSESRVAGHGHAAGGHAVEHVRFEVVVDKGQAERCQAAIAEAAQTGAAGDGLIVVLPVLSEQRIRDHRTG